MLYEGAIRFIQQAMEAIRSEDAEQRYDKLTRASEIIVALRSALHTETQDSEVERLYGFYTDLDIRILALHRSHNLGECANIVAELRDVRDAWDAIDRAEKR